MTKCILDDPSVSQLSSEEKSREIGKMLVISPERITIVFRNFSDTCNNPALIKNEVAPNIYFKNDIKERDWLGF